MLTAIVEPYFLGSGASTPLGSSFSDFRASVSASHPSVSFYPSVSSIPPRVSTAPLLVVICGRTSENPLILSDVIASLRPSAVYLEKPGAPSVSVLQEMSSSSSVAGVPVFVGFNKNVSPYARNAKSFFEQERLRSPSRRLVVTFGSNNNYADDEGSLSECFFRNSEGLLKNMSIHELSLLTSFFGIKAGDGPTVIVDDVFSDLRTLQCPDGVSRTDLTRVAVRIQSVRDPYLQVCLKADRCGGTDSYAFVADAETGELLYKSDLVEMSVGGTDALAAREERFKGAMPYFLSQDADYATMKEEVAKAARGETPDKDVPTIDGAVETLSLAEYLNKAIFEALGKK